MNRVRLDQLRLIGIPACLSIALLVGACAGTGASNLAERASLGQEVAVITSAEDPQVLGASEAIDDGLTYIAGAGAGLVEGEGSQLVVTLSEVATEVLWFRDAPELGIGEIRISVLVGQWDERGFAADAPIAVIGHDADGASGGTGVAVKMSDPVWDQPTGTLRFTAEPVEAVEPDGETLPWLMSDVSLFIDDKAA